MISIDIKTLAKTPDAVILSIGACEFNSQGEILDQFYITVDRKSQPDRRECPETIEWWDKQSEEAKQDAFEGEIDLPRALIMLIEWLKPYQEEVICTHDISSNLAILTHALGGHRLWKFYNEMEFRTIRLLAIAVDLTIPPREGEHHNALDEAIYQAKCISTWVREYGTR